MEISSLMIEVIQIENKGRAGAGRRGEAVFEIMYSTPKEFRSGFGNAGFPRERSK